jgi:hypothetical protein
MVLSLFSIEVVFEIQIIEEQVGFGSWPVPQLFSAERWKSEPLAGICNRKIEGRCG